MARPAGVARFKIDENLAAAAVALFAAHGHDAVTVSDEGLAGISDHRLADVVRREGRAIVTQE